MNGRLVVFYGEARESDRRLRKYGCLFFKRGSVDLSVLTAKVKWKEMYTEIVY
jgi:hypothetical protein